MRRIFVCLVMMTALILILILVSGYRSLMIPVLSSSGSDSVTIAISRGSTARQITDTLHRNGLIRSRFWFGILLSATGEGNRLKAGTYRFSEPRSAVDILGILVEGVPGAGRTVLIPEGLTAAETVSLLTELGFGDRKGFDTALTGAMPLINRFDPQAPDAEGYLFPDTYQFSENADERAIIGILIRRFIETACLVLGDSPGGLGERRVREITTLASLVEEETGLPDERPLVAGVFANRLKRGMLLQCDPTVIYALKRAGRYSGSPLRLEDLQFQSPYNTYLHPDLPPGPISCPGRAALEAAVSPSNVDYLYFVARVGGGHTFSTTLQDHHRAVRLYRAAKNKKQG